MRKIGCTIAGHNCGISDDGISQLNLSQLYAYMNHKITGVNL